MALLTQRWPRRRVSHAQRPDYLVLQGASLTLQLVTPFVVFTHVFMRIVFKFTGAPLHGNVREWPHIVPLAPSVVLSDFTKPFCQK